MLDFPNHPTIGQVFGDVGLSWTWDGVKWTSVPTNLTGPFLPIAGGAMAGPLTTQNLTVNGTITGTGIGYDIGDIPGPIVSNNGLPGGIAALHPPAELIFQRASSRATDGQDFHFRRATAFTGGTSANINKTVLVDTGIGANDAASNWGFTSKISTASASASAVGLSAYLQTWRSAGGKSQCWGAVVEMSDFTGLKSSLVVGPTNSMEIDLGTTDIDDATNPSKWGGIGNRHIIHFVVARNQGALLNEVSHGLWFGTNGSYIDSLIGADLGPGAAGAMVRQIIDTRGFIPPTGVTDPVASVRMSAAQIVDFKGGPALNSAPGNYLQYTTTGTPRLRYMVGATEQFSFPDAGGATIGAAGPSITTGSAVPASTQPKGSIYLRTAGAVGSTFYVSQGAGTWNAVAGA